MRTYYVFQSRTTPELRGFTDDEAGEALPADQGPWALDRQIGPDDEWTLDVSRAVVAAGIIENGFYLWGPINRTSAWHPVIESDRVEGTAVYDPRGTQIGTIKRLLMMTIDIVVHIKAHGGRRCITGIDFKPQRAHEEH